MAGDEHGDDRGESGGHALERDHAAERDVAGGELRGDGGERTEERGDEEPDDEGEPPAFFWQATPRALRRRAGDQACVGVSRDGPYGEDRGEESDEEASHDGVVEDAGVAGPGDAIAAGVDRCADRRVDREVDRCGRSAQAPREVGEAV